MSVRMKSAVGEIQRYRKSCKTRFWQNIFQAEAEYLLCHLRTCRNVLSVGCGPAIVEGMLVRDGFNIVGLDVDVAKLGSAPDTVLSVVGRAERMPFASASFDAVIFVASLQFIENYREAVAEARRVLRKNGRLIIMLLNPASLFFRAKLCDSRSYVRKLRHRDLSRISAVVARHFNVRTEYFLGVRGTSLLKSRDPATSALFVIKGVRKEPSP